MGEDRPLTAFTGEAEDAETDPDDGHDAETDPDADSDTTTEGDGSQSPGPAGTYRWDPDGAECPRCGAPSDRQWIDDGAFVCPECKSWS